MYYIKSNETKIPRGKKQGELWRATPIYARTMHKARAFRVRVRPVAAIQLSKLDL